MTLGIYVRPSLNPTWRILKAWDFSQSGQYQVDSGPRSSKYLHLNLSILGNRNFNEGYFGGWFYQFLLHQNEFWNSLVKIKALSSLENLNLAKVWMFLCCLQWFYGSKVIQVAMRITLEVVCISFFCIEMNNRIF